MPLKKGDRIRAYIDVRKLKAGFSKPRCVGFRELKEEEHPGRIEVLDDNNQVAFIFYSTEYGIIENVSYKIKDR